MLNRKQKDIIRLLQGDMPVSKRPFAELAAQLSISEDELLHELRFLQQEGYLRRLSSVLYHRKAGFTYNVMVAWKVEESRIDNTGKLMSSSPHTTHVYQRETHPQWPYNLYTMIHGKDENECMDIVASLSQLTGETDYILLPSIREFKKTSMKYF